MPEEVRADLLIGRDTLSPGLVKAGKAASDASSNVRQLTRDLYEAGKTRATPIVDLNDDAATAKLESVSAKLKELGAAVADPKVNVEDKEAQASLAAMRVKLDALGKKVSSPRVTLEGLARAEAGILTLDVQLDRLSRKHATPSAGVTRGLLSRLGGGIGGAAGGIVGAGGAIGSGFAGLAGGSGGILAAIAAGLALGPAAIPLGLGGLTAGGGGLLAATLGVKGTAALKTDAQAVARARAAIAGGGKTTPTQRLALQRALAQQSRDQAKFGAFAPFGNVITQLGNIGQGVLGAALTGTGPGFSGGGPGGTQNASFLTGLTDILKQLGGFVKSIGPQLGDLFRASLPFAQAFVKVLEQFTKAVLPSMTQSLKELAPDLPILIQGFKYLSEGIAGFIQNLGPGIRDSAVIFKASMLVVKGFLQLAGLAAADFAKGIVDTGRAVRAFARGVPPFFDKMRHDIATIFDGVRHDIAHYWDVIYNDTIGNVIRIDKGIIGWFDRIPGQILGALRGLGHTLGSFAAAALNEMWDGFKRIGSDIIGWVKGFGGGIIGILKKVWGIFSPSSVFYDMGKNLMLGLFHGIKDHTSHALGALGALGAGAVSGGLGGNVTSWITQALKITREPLSWLPALQRLVSLESGGNPRAVNPVSVGGEHATGLFQTLPSTFAAYSLGGSIFNPVADAVAGIRYLAARYGSPYGIPGLFGGTYRGYAAGGMITEPILGVGRSGRMYGFGERGPEMVVPGRGGAGGGGITVHIHAPVGSNPRDIGKTLADYLKAYQRGGGKILIG